MEAEKGLGMQEEAEVGVGVWDQGWGWDGNEWSMEIQVKMEHGSFKRR